MLKQFQLTQELQVAKDEKMKKFLDETIFPAEKVPDNIQVWKRIVLALTTPQSLNVSNNYFVTLLRKDAEEFSLQEMLVILKAAEYLCYYDCRMFCISERIAMDEETYCSFLQEMAEATTEFNNTFEPKKNAIDREFNTKASIAAGASKKQIYS